MELFSDVGSIPTISTINDMLQLSEVKKFEVVCILLVLVAIGVKMIVYTCIRQSAYNKLLEEGDYTRLNKRVSKYDEIYWGVAIVVYLAWSFITMRWELTWIVWPIAGVLFGLFKAVLRAIASSK